MLNFSIHEIRILGCLIEKQLATPDYYPMTANSLTLAANQKTSRDPVMALAPDEIEEALGALSRKEFVEQVKESGSRAFKFRQRLDLRWGVSTISAETQRDQLAVLAVLALRGSQTLGQIRQRTERMFNFSDISQLPPVIEELKQETEERPALITEDLTATGRETRYIHLLGDHPFSSGTVVASLAPELKVGLEERMQLLEARVSELEKLLGSSSTPEGLENSSSDEE